MSGAIRMEIMERAGAWVNAAKSNPYFPRALGGGAVVALLDQASKYWIVNIVRLPERGKIEISGVFDLSYVQNTGASFGMLAGGGASRAILTLISVAVALGLVYWLAGLRRAAAAAAIALIIGGAVGNLYDRLVYGFVIDFFDFSGLHFPWVFNVADAAINIGIGLLLLDAWLSRDRKNPGKDV